MKKILSMGIASAVLALTAIAASAEYVAASNENPVNGGTIVVEVTSTVDLEMVDFKVSAEGLEFVSVDVPTGGLVGTSTNEDGSINVAGVGTFAAGTPLATITYTVTGETGSNVKVTLDKFKDDAATFAAPLELTVVEGTDPGSDPVDPGETPVDPGETPVDPGEQPGGDDPTTPPETGVALAIVPAVLAGAAVVVAKKRK